MLETWVPVPCKAGVPLKKNHTLQCQSPRAISYFLWFVSYLNVLGNGVRVTTKKDSDSPAVREMDRKVCVTTTTSYTKINIVII